MSSALSSLPIVLRNSKAILALLTVLNLLNYLDRYVLSAVIAPIERDLGLSNFTAGLLPTIFLIGYFATSPIFGHLADKRRKGDRKRLMAFGVGVWSLATVGSGLAQGLTSMSVARSLVGLGEASYATIAPTLIDDLAPPGRAAAWMSIFYAAMPVGSALGYVVGGEALHAFGWHGAFYVAGFPGLACALLCLAIREPERASGAAGPGRQGARPLEAARALALVPLYRHAVLGYCAFTFAIGGFAYWAPKYVHTSYALEAGRASVLFGVVTVLGGAIGTLLGGIIADRATRRRLDRTRSSLPSPPSSGDSRVEDAAIARTNLTISAIFCMIGVPLAAAAIAAPTAHLFFALVLPCQIALFILTGPINLAILRSAPPELRASAMAASIFAVHALGDLWSPPLIGLLADQMPMRLAMFAAPLVFAVAGILWWRAASSQARLTETARVS